MEYWSKKEYLNYDREIYIDRTWYVFSRPNISFAVIANFRQASAQWKDAELINLSRM